MAVKLVLKKNADDSDVEEYTFDQEQISLGREKANDLHIPDTSRVVSKKHAVISCLEGACEIEDLGSKNFTYVNDARLEAGRACTLSNGDVIRVGEYEITFVILDPEPEPEPPPEAPPDHDRTVFESDFVNPFDESVGRLFESIDEICAIFDDEAPNRRADALRYALETHNAKGGHEARALVLHLLGGGAEQSGVDSAGPVVAGGVRRPASNGEQNLPVRSGNASPAVAHVHQGALGHYEQVLDVLVNVLSMLVSIPWEFRHEFVGHTIAQTPESAVLYEGNGEKLKNFLLDPDLSEEELAQRLVLIEEGGDEVILHQLAMLDGYKAVVQQGMHMLLREIDPIVAAEKLCQTGGIYRVIPRYARLVASWGLQEKFKELRAEDWSITERRAYRPSFIRAYLARMSSGPRKVSDPA